MSSYFYNALGPPLYIKEISSIHAHENISDFPKGAPTTMISGEFLESQDMNAEHNMNPCPRKDFRFSQRCSDHHGLRRVFRNTRHQRRTRREPGYNNEQKRKCFHCHDNLLGKISESSSKHEKIRPVGKCCKKKTRRTNGQEAAGYVPFRPIPTYPCRTNNSSSLSTRRRNFQ